MNGFQYLIFRMNGFNGPPMNNNIKQQPPGPPMPGGFAPPAGPPGSVPKGPYGPPQTSSIPPPGGPPMPLNGNGFNPVSQPPRPGPGPLGPPTPMGAPPTSTQSQPPMGMGPPRPGVPPVSQPGMPPMPQPGGPPMSQPGMMPPISQAGMPGPQQISQPGMPPPLSQPGMPPMSHPGAMPPRPSQPPGPPMSQPGSMPPTRSGQPPNMSQPGMPGPPMPGQFNAAPPPMMPPGPGGFAAPPQPGPAGPGANQYGMPPAPGGQMPPRPGMPPTGLGAPPGPGGFPGQAAASPGRRTLDPDQMPSPIQVMEEDQRTNGGFFDTREKGHPPPLVTTKFVTRDYGNASPRFMRSTMYYVPSSEDMRKQTGVPFGLVISPMAQVGADEIEPPVTDFGPSGPVRCIRCKAYMCSMMQFIDGGRRFQCAFCKATTEVPPEYFQHLDHNGLRVDHYNRAELCLGTYECTATKDYCREGKEPNVPAILFAIDVSYPMIKEGIVPLICSNMKEMLKHLPRDMNCDKVMILNCL